MRKLFCLPLCIINCALCILSSCGRHYNNQESVKEEITKEQMMSVNRALVHGESERIDTFIKRRQFKMQTTGTGLRYEIYQKGSGKLPSESSIITIAFKEYLLNDTLCYSVDEAKPLTTKLGTGEQVRGLEEGLMLMPEGSRAHLIIPSHLAYGFSGDGNEIPPGSALYYDLHLISVK